MSSVGAFSRLVSRQAAHPSGFLGRIIGRIWAGETAGVNDEVLTAVDPQPGETVLEIDHGPGRALHRILRAGAEAVGVEVSRTMSRQAHRRNRQAVADGRLRLLVGDGTKLPVTVPGGRLVIASRDGAQPVPRRLDPTIYSIPTIEELNAWMTDAGFKITTQQTLGEVLVVEATRAKRRELAK